MATVTAPLVGPGDLEALLRCLLPTAPVQTPPPHPVPTDVEILLERLLPEAPVRAPTPPPQTGITGMETLLQRLLPGTPGPALQPRPDCRNWTTIVCFSCGKPGHGLGRCPELDEHPIHVAGMVDRESGRQLHDDLATWCTPGGKRRLIREGVEEHVSFPLAQGLVEQPVPRPAGRHDDSLIDS